MDEQNAQKGKYVTFQSGAEYYGLKIQYVNEIIVFQEITEIPESKPYLKGLINLRGKIIPVIDVRIRFGQEPFTYTDRTCIIVINCENNVVGLIVEKIAEVVEIPDESVLPAPSLCSKADKSQGKFVYAIGKVGDEIKLLLDPDKLLNDEDRSVIEKAGEETANQTDEGEEES